MSLARNAALVALVALLSCGYASAQQAPFTLDDRFDTLLDRIEVLETERQALEAERVSLRRDLAASIEREAALVERVGAAEDARDAALAERDVAAVRAELELSRRETVTADRDLAVNERDAAIRARDDLADELEGVRAEAEARRAELQAQLDALIAQRDAAPAEAVAVVRPVESPRCADELSTSVEGVVASLVVTNPCRANQTLRVRAADPSDPLLGQLRASFDASGTASLQFPVLSPDTRLRVFGAVRSDFQDVVLEPADDAADTLAVLRWEDASVDLDLVVGPGSGDGRTSLGPRTDIDAAPGRYALVQGDDSAQLPRFEVFVPDADAPALALGVDHASRGARAEPPFCDDADAAAPRLLVTLRSAGALQQIRDAFEALPCGGEVPAAQRGRVLRTLR